MSRPLCNHSTPLLLRLDLLEVRKIDHIVNMHNLVRFHLNINFRYESFCHEQPQNERNVLYAKMSPVINVPGQKDLGKRRYVSPVW